MKKDMPLEGLRWSRDSGSALYDTPPNGRSRTGWGDVLVIVIDVGILCHWLQVLLPAVMLGEHFGKRGLSTTDISCYCYVHFFLY